MEENNQQSTSPEPINGAPVSPENTDTNQNDSVEMKPVVPESPKKSKKPLVILGVVLLLLIAGALAWYFVFRDKGQDTTQSVSNEQQVEEQELLTLPDTVAYAYRESDTEPYKLYTRPATGGERTEVMTLPDDSYISQSVVHGRQVAFAVEPGSESSEKLTVYYSNDSGASYDKIYTDTVEVGESGLGTQLTSLIFSNDGKDLVLALLGSEFDGNKVVKISLNNPGTPEEIFSSEKAGVFLRGYDSSSRRVVYFEGCYNCDGNGYNELLLYESDNNKSEVLHKSTDGVVLYVAVNKEFSEVLLSEGTTDPSADGLGDTSKAPFKIFTVNIESKDKKDVTTLEEGKVQGVGYTPTGTPYVYADQKVIKLSETNSNLFETAGNLYWNGNWYVGDDSVVVSVGSSDSSEYAINYFKLGDAEPTNVLNGDGNTVIFGVTLKAE